METHRKKTPHDDDGLADRARELKSFVTIVDILLSLGWEVGRANRTRCPIHAGDNPTSFWYDQDHFRCYSCGAHGDQIDLVQRLLNVEFREAVGYLATLAGARVPSSATERCAERPLRWGADRILAVAERAVDSSLRELETGIERYAIDCYRRCERERKAGTLSPAKYWDRIYLLDQMMIEFDRIVCARRDSGKQRRSRVDGRPNSCHRDGLE